MGRLDTGETGVVVDSIGVTALLRRRGISDAARDPELRIR